MTTGERVITPKRSSCLWDAEFIPEMDGCCPIIMSLFTRIRDDDAQAIVSPVSSFQVQDAKERALLLPGWGGLAHHGKRVHLPPVDPEEQINPRMRPGGYAPLT